MTSPATAPVARAVPAYNSFASRKRSSPAVKPLPEAVAWLKDLKLEMTTTNSIRSAVQYNLKLVYQPQGAAASSWDVRRSFDEYRSFQKRLLRQLQPKHSCKAECRWLYSTVKKHFPKPTLLGSHCPPIVDQRRRALLQLLRTVQASIVNHGNRNCKIMMGDVSQEFAAFLSGDAASSADGATPPLTPTTGSEMETTAGSLPSFTGSVTSDDGEEEDTVNYEMNAFADWRRPVEHNLIERTSSSPL
ncbi:hypothetical protein PF005_g21540 [Phytophthora fragariae]|uniref:PX domain-containing protein n=1 Tax=Phytophthora fragariae TaxID=53985 RepID=A0A6A3WJS0_9STRA|nr:hypothetical protein PF003_g33943 [Phytophthora fragariae]KAE8927548.1 hypothetical protein PF009_g22284 [Phytophthora fragariae]KAE9074656.1 hypothetical protein PF006_g28496 [Phytophthora fragariae]KAE9084695.1 hypothetical protein PF007_g21418 [Phytophthora fragariae]KAE9184779.1 hypothetical protein PF005_g21540 [Phytophthora fragariae]